MSIFTPQEIEILKSIGVEMTVEPGHFVYMAGDAADRIYYILKGRLRVFENVSSGREVTIDVVAAGRMIGESAFFENRVRPVCVQAVNTVQLISCRVSDLLPYFQKLPGFALHMLQHCSETMDHLTYRLHEQCLLDRYGKVASFILEITASDSKENGTEGGIMPYTHEELAVSLGLGRPTVSTVLRKFEERGWIKSGYRFIKIVDRQALVGFVERQKAQ